ncbi:pyrroloquinoline quinone precursor peptide PqqA [Streptomyces sp. NPDC051173]|uniref:pyrroloquinoline quinone precursor peptide PqqA n=1 Tax=Streptomyces sp. NPDC051173 TaxID=3155164 RepID=UPI00344E28F7
MAEAVTTSVPRPVTESPAPGSRPGPVTAERSAGTARQAPPAPRESPGGPALRPWSPPAFTDIELGQEVTAYAGRW